MHAHGGPGHREERWGHQRREMVAAKRGLATTSFDHVRQAARLRGGEDPFRGFAAITIHTKAGNCVFVSAYMAPSWGPGSPNQAKLAALAAFLAAIDDPWAVAADWNLKPAQLRKPGFPSRVGGEIVVPSETSVNCTKGKGSMIDYCLVQRDFVSNVKVQAIWEVPWKVHCGLDVELLGAQDQWWARRLVVPRELPRVMRPKAEADPDSKTSKAKRQRLLERSTRLPEALQDAFVELQGEEQEGVTSPECQVPFAIATETWLQASPKGPQGTAPYLAATAELDGHLVYQLPGAKAGEEGISKRYAHWVSRLEETILDHHDMEEGDRTRYRGCCRGYEVAWKRLKSTPGRVHMRCHKAERMNSRATLVQR